MGKLGSRGRLIYSPKIVMTTPRSEKEIYVPVRFFKYLIVIGLIGGIIYFLFFSSFFKVKQIEVIGDISEEGRMEIQKYKGKNIFLINSVELGEGIKKVYPEVISANIYRGLPDALKVVTKSRSGVVIWQTNGRYYLIDDLGVAFKQIGSGDLFRNKELPYIIDTQNLGLRTGKKVISLKFINFVQYFNKNFKGKIGFGIKNWDMNETTVNTTLVVDNGWKVFLDTSKDAENQLNDLSLIVEKNKKDIHEYIDLRVEGYGYYK